MLPWKFSEGPSSPGLYAEGAGRLILVKYSSSLS